VHMVLLRCVPPIRAPTEKPNAAILCEENKREKGGEDGEGSKERGGERGKEKRYTR
jgi:hypothetical protein